jgi:hypothetical protein
VINYNRRRFIGAAVATGAGLAMPSLGATPRIGEGSIVLPPAAAPISTGEPPALLARARAAMDSHSSLIANRDLVALVDFNEQSRVPRLHLLDMGNGRLLSTHLVAHGRGSDPENSGWAKHFSNQPGSNASSQGAFLTGPTYVGKHGRSRRLQGLDPENCNAEERGIVIHQASYVDPRMAESQGRIGRSEGCFALSSADIYDVLTRLTPGTLLFAGR